MPATTACPGQAELELLLLGRIDGDREALLLEHLAGCDRCAGLASSLHAEDDLVATMRERSPILSGADGEVDTVVERAREGVVSTMTRPTGEVGPYPIECLLGSGGTSVVYRTRGVSAVMEEKIGRLADAAASWEKAVSYKPGEGKLFELLDLSKMWLKAGNLRKGVAVADGLRSVAAKQDKSNPWVRLAGRYELAAEVAGKDASLPPEERDRIQANCHVEAFLARARAAYIELAKLFPKTPPIRDEKR